MNVHYTLFLLFAFICLRKSLIVAKLWCSRNTLLQSGRLADTSCRDPFSKKYDNNLPCSQHQAAVNVDIVYELLTIDYLLYGIVVQKAEQHLHLSVFDLLGFLMESLI